MTTTDHAHGTELRGSIQNFNVGNLEATIETFAEDVTFVVPGKSAVAGTYRGRESLAAFFKGLHDLSGGSFSAKVEEVLANDDRMVLFLRFSAKRDGEDDLDVLMAGFHDDKGPDGWRKATFLVDDQAAFDHFFREV